MKAYCDFCEKEFSNYYMYECDECKIEACSKCYETENFTFKMCCLSYFCSNCSWSYSESEIDKDMSKMSISKN